MLERIIISAAMMFLLLHAVSDLGQWLFPTSELVLRVSKGWIYSVSFAVAIVNTLLLRNKRQAEANSV